MMTQSTSDGRLTSDHDDRQNVDASGTLSRQLLGKYSAESTRPADWNCAAQLRLLVLAGNSTS
jgi:hypothetical protein